MIDLLYTTFMEIYNSLDWGKVEQPLLMQISRLKHPHNDDARKMVTNIGKMITELSKNELKARRSPTPEASQRRVAQEVLQINRQIQDLEQWITLLLLY
jgi:hypothetical protein